MPTCLTSGHSYTSQTVVYPTCLGAGTIKKTCSTCGATSYESTDALGHNGDPCSRCGYTEQEETKTSISTASFSSVSAQTYTGSAITPSPTVTLNGTELVKNTDYTLSYSNNVNVGTATITATGKGDYTGTVSTTFTINKKSVAKPTAVEGLTYNGDEQVGVVAGEGYTLTNNKRTNAGSYTATATLDSNHI